MQKLTQELWSKLSFPDYRARFFIESWWLLLSMRTPHFYQARLMNSYSIMREIGELIMDFTSDGKNINQLRMSCKEALDVISGDADFHKFHEGNWLLLGEMLKGIAKEREAVPSIEKIRKLHQLVSALLQSEDEFVAGLLDGLFDTLTDEIDLTSDEGKSRKLAHIYSLTGKLVSCLLSIGYSPTYLFNRAELFIYPSRYKGRKYVEQLQLLFERLKAPSAKYTVIIPVIFSKRFSVPAKIDGVKVLKEAPVKLDEKERFKLGMIKADSAESISAAEKEMLYLTKEITAKDYVSAAWEMKRCMDSVRDVVTFEFKQNVFNYISPKCLVVYRDPIVHKHVVPIELLSALLIARSDAYQSESMIEILNNATDMHDAYSNVKESINRIIRYHRLGIEEATLEPKLLNIWIVLEAIVGGGEGNIIDNILQVIPELYAFDSLRKRLQFMLELFKKHAVEIPPEILSKAGCDSLPVDNILGLKLVYTIVSNPEYALAVFNTLGENEFVKFVLHKMHKEFETPKAVQARIEKTKEDVSLQIRRIYYLRNKIVHQAHHDGIAVRLFSHLYDYVEYIMCDILVGLYGAPRPISNLSEISDGYLMAMEQRKLEWKGKTSLSFEEVYYLSAIV